MHVMCGCYSLSHGLDTRQCHELTSPVAGYAASPRVPDRCNGRHGRRCAGQVGSNVVWVVRRRPPSSSPRSPLR
eukprot:5723022-Prymnesium_polylepis.1